MNSTLYFQIIHSVTPAQLFPWLETALSIFSAGEQHRGSTFWVEFFIKQGSWIFAKQKLFSCVQSLNLIGLDPESFDVWLVDIDTEQVETRTASTMVILYHFLLSWIQIDKTLEHLLWWCNKINLWWRRLKFLKIWCDLTVLTQSAANSLHLFFQIARCCLCLPKNSAHFKFKSWHLIFSLL